MEARKLEIYQRLIEVAQALDELIKKTPRSHLELKKKNQTKEKNHLKQVGKENQENESNESLS